MTRFRQGKFTPKNIGKYRGNPSEIYYRSKWELTFMMYCDRHPDIIEWSSEEVIITYRSILDELYEKKHNLNRKRWHRYFVDFYIKVKEKDNSIKKYLIEIKPYHETVQPLVEGTNKSKKTITRQRITWIINNAKWKAAIDFCNKRDMTFKILTEKELYGYNRS